MGWKFTGYGKCSACSAPLEWWETPLGKKFPADRCQVNLKEGHRVEDAASQALIRERSHFGSCPNAANFRKKKPGEDDLRVTVLDLLGALEFVPLAHPSEAVIAVNGLVLSDVQRREGVLRKMLNLPPRHVEALLDPKEEERL